MKYEELKCEFCEGAGEISRDNDGMAVEYECHYCNGTGIDNEQLNKLMNERFAKKECVYCRYTFDQHGEDMTCPDMDFEGHHLGWRETKFNHIEL